MTSMSILVMIAGAIFVGFLLVNRNTQSREREGRIKSILDKAAFSIEFNDQPTMVVKLFGLTPASDNEMLDEKIHEFLDAHLQGQRVRIRPQKVVSGDMMVASLYTLAGEYINAVMVKQGFARWSPSEAANDRELMEAQEHAKSNQLGVWNPAVRQLMEERLRRIAAGELEEDVLQDRPIGGDPVR